MSAHPNIDPRLSILIDQSSDLARLRVSGLQTDDVLEVETGSDLYTMKVTDPAEGLVLATSTGKFITSEVEARVLGATLTGSGSMVTVGTIACGLRFVLAVRGGELLLYAKEIRVNGTTFCRAKS